MSERCLEGRVVVLTGGAGLLGRNHCKALSSVGARVVVADIDAPAAHVVVEALEDTEAMAVAVDVTSANSVRRMVEQVSARFGRIDALVNNAALDPKFDRANAEAHTDSFESYPLEVWRQSLDVNLTGPFLCTQAAAPLLLSSGRGVVVNIASIYGLVGPDQRLYEENGKQLRFKPVAYSVTKSALFGFTRYLATYWAGTGLRVNTLTLGGVESDHDPEFVRRYSERTPLGRMARQDEYGAALVFLLSDASSYMTGANLVVDGGWTAW
jgi:NAD(P)-dependent dehydrogenase (short-subunit alcohol dehydrogenase family)